MKFGRYRRLLSQWKNFDWICQLWRNSLPLFYSIVIAFFLDCWLNCVQEANGWFATIKYVNNWLNGKWFSNCVHMWQRSGRGDSEKNGWEKKCETDKRKKPVAHSKKESKINGVQMKSIQKSCRTRVCVFERRACDDDPMVCKFICKQCVEIIHLAEFVFSLHIWWLKPRLVCMLLFFMLVGSCRWPFY